jgi:hypothetical protein
LEVFYSSKIMAASLACFGADEISQEWTYLKIGFLVN